MKIRQLYGLILREDPKHSELTAIRQQADLEMAKIMAQAQIKRQENEIARDLDSTKKSYDRHEKAKQKTFDREEQTMQHMHELSIMLRAKAAEEIASIQQERIRDAIEVGEPVGSVGADSWMLLNAYDEKLRRGDIIDALPNYDHGVFDKIDEDIKTDENAVLSSDSEASNTVSPTHSNTTNQTAFAQTKDQEIDDELL